MAKKLLFVLFALVLIALGAYYFFFRNSDKSNNITVFPAKDFSYFYILQGDAKLSDAQVEFLVSHYDIVMIKGWLNAQKVDKMHQIAKEKNPDFKVLKYTNGLFSLSYKPENGSPAYAFNNSSKDEFNRIKDTQYNQGWFLMDLCSKAWQDYFISSAKSEIDKFNIDGIFIDDMGMASGIDEVGRIDNFPQDRNTKENYSNDSWYSCGKDFLGQVNTQLASKKVFFNGLYHNPPKFDREYLSVSDGGMREGWITSNYSDFLGEKQWKSLVNASIEDLEKYDSGFIPFCLIDNPKATINDALFCYTSFLLVNQSDRVFYGPPKGKDGLKQIYFRPELSIDIGKPIQNEKSLDDLKDSKNSSLYSRRYSNGLVIVNPTNNGFSYDLEKEYYLVKLFGSGLVDKDGKVDAKLEYEKKDSITISKQSGVVLLESLPI